MTNRNEQTLNDAAESVSKLSDVAIAFLSQGHSTQVWATGKSMLPFLRPGTVVRIAPISSTSELKVGDVAFVQCNGRLMLHRVVRADPKLVTKGDAVPAFDPPVEKVYGRVVGQGGVSGWLIALLSRRLQPVQFALLCLKKRFWRARTRG